MAAPWTRRPASRVKIVFEHSGHRQNVGAGVIGARSADRKRLMPRKLFIVERGNEQLFLTLSEILRDEPDVEVIYDRRRRDEPEVRPAAERRVPSEVDQRLRAEGYAVVWLSTDDRSSGNIHWSC
jgi:hypothetical protein